MVLRDRFEDLRTRFESMEASKRTRLIRGSVLGAAVVIIVSLYYLTGQDEKKPAPPPEKMAVIELGDARLEDDVRASVSKTAEEMGNRVSATNKTIEGQQLEIEKQKAQLAAMQATLQSLTAQPGLSLPDLPGQGSAPNDSQTWADGTAAKSPSARTRLDLSPAGKPPSAPPAIEWVGGIGKGKGAGAPADGKG